MFSNIAGDRIASHIDVGEREDNANAPQPTGVHPRTGQPVRVEQSGGVTPGALLASDTATARFTAELRAPPSPLEPMQVSRAEQGESSREKAHEYAQGMVEYFQRSENRDKIYPAAIVKIKREYQDYNTRLLSAGRGAMAGPRFWFDPILLDAREQSALNRQVEKAIAGVAPQELKSSAETAATDFLKEIAESRTGNDPATCLCRWMAGRTEMTADERWSVMSNVVSASGLRLNDRRLTIKFYERLEELTSEVFIKRAQDYVHDLEADLIRGNPERFFPADVLSLRSSALGLVWSSPLPSLSLSDSARDRLNTAILEIAKETKPLTERPDARLHEALESHLSDYANDIVANTPTLFAFREIAAMNGLSQSQKLHIASEIDTLISGAPEQFPQDLSGCPQFFRQLRARQCRGLRLAINALVEALPDVEA